MADSNWSDVASLLHFDGSSGATSTTDSSSTPHTWTFNAAGGSSPALSSSTSASGPTCLKVIQGHGDVTSDTHADFELSSFSAYTVEGFFQLDAANQGQLIQFVDGTNANSASLLFNHDGTNCRISISASPTLALGTSGPLSLSAMHHFAWDINSGTSTVYIDGVSVLSQVISLAGVSHASFVRLAKCNNSGYIYQDEVRITKNVRRYTAAFTAPTAPFPVGLTTAVATGIAPGNLGTPTNALTQPASGFLATVFGTATVRLIQPASGFTSTHFGSGTNRLTQPASGFQSGALGTPGNRLTQPATALGPTAHLGTPGNKLTQAASGFNGTHFGTPGINLREYASGFRQTAFGTPYAVFPQFCNATGFRSTAFGATSARQFNRVRLPIGRVTRFGTPAVYPPQHKAASIGNISRFGIPNLAPWVRPIARSLGPVARFGTPVTATHVAQFAPLLGARRTAFGTPIALIFEP